MIHVHRFMRANQPQSLVHFNSTASLQSLLISPIVPLNPSKNTSPTSSQQTSCLPQNSKFSFHASNPLDALAPIVIAIDFEVDDRKRNVFPRFISISEAHHEGTSTSRPQRDVPIRKEIFGRITNGYISTCHAGELQP
jgi:hypothetical protein